MLKIFKRLSADFRGYFQVAVQRQCIKLHAVLQLYEITLELSWGHKYYLNPISKVVQISELCLHRQ